MTEQRSSPRNRTLLPARIEITEIGVVAACTIRDLSDCGARLEIPNPPSLPLSFTLFIPRFDRRVRVTRRWQRGDVLGVSFEGEATETQDAKYVKKLEEEIARLRSILESIRADPAMARYLLDEVA